MKKAFLSKSDPYLGLLDHRNTPTAATGMSPSLRLFGRQTKTLLSFSQSLLKYNKLVSDRLKKDRVKQAKYFEQHAKQLSELNPGETQWSQAVVSSKIAPRSYRVEANGKVYRWNRKQLRQTKEELQESSLDIDEDESMSAHNVPDLTESFPVT